MTLFLFLFPSHTYIHTFLLSHLSLSHTLIHTIDPSQEFAKAVEAWRSGANVTKISTEKKLQSVADTFVSNLDHEYKLNCKTIEMQQVAARARLAEAKLQYELSSQQQLEFSSDDIEFEAIEEAEVDGIIDDRPLSLSSENNAVIPILSHSPERNYLLAAETSVTSPRSLDMQLLESRLGYDEAKDADALVNSPMYYTVECDDDDSDNDE